MAWSALEASCGEIAVLNYRHFTLLFSWELADIAKNLLKRSLMLLDFAQVAFAVISLKSNRRFPRFMPKVARLTAFP
jgi:hypothetical protein